MGKLVKAIFCARDKPRAWAEELGAATYLGWKVSNVAQVDGIVCCGELEVFQEVKHKPEQKGMK